MTPKRRKEFVAISNRLLKVKDDFDKLFAATVNKRMPIEHAMVMDNAAFGLMMTSAAIRGMLDILHEESPDTNEEAKGSDKARVKVQRRARVGNR